MFILDGDSGLCNDAPANFFSLCARCDHPWFWIVQSHGWVGGGDFWQAQTEPGSGSWILVLVLQGASGIAARF